ncbi:retinol dehydrogenase 12 [Xylaria cubensis]|nr:retinol dehydrogenase 12 [Xylaria cubensis]
MSDFNVSPEKRATKRAFLKRQFSVIPPAVTKTEVSLDGKTAIITGGNTGIGLETGRQLLELGLGRLILAVRSESRGQDAKKELTTSKSSDEQIVEVWLLDLASYDSITSFIDRAKRLDRLDIFVNNAGIAKKVFKINKNTNHEETWQINYLSTSLLTILALPILKEKNSPEQPGRLVNVNSDVASWARFKERDSIPLLTAFDRRSNFDSQDRYYTSKLLCQLFVSELAKRVPATVAVINAPNPGLCSSSLQREFGGTVLGFVFDFFKKILARDASTGARVVVDAAIRQGRASHGQYLEDCKIQPMAPIVYKPEGIKIANQLWKETLGEFVTFQASDLINNLSAR